MTGKVNAGRIMLSASVSPDSEPDRTDDDPLAAAGGASHRHAVAGRDLTDPVGFDASFEDLGDARRSGTAKPKSPPP